MSPLRSRPSALGAVALAVTLALAGCGGDHEGHDEAAQADTAAATGADTTTGAGTTDAGADTAAKPQFNSADVLFVQGMIPHHAQAIEMAALAKGRTTNKQVLKLATAIHGAQDPEIQQMTAWLKAWDKPLPADAVAEAHAEEEAGGHAHAEGESDDHGHAEEPEAPHAHGGEGGMMTAAQMASLKKLKGKKFDKQFLTLMIEHHAGAVASAKQTIERGLNADVKELCRAIVKGQTAEITLMKQLLKA